MNYLIALLYFICGVSAVTLIATLGAIASRRLNFKYPWLTILSVAVYIYLGYITAKEYGLYTAILVNALVGFYDATIGLKLSVALHANFGVGIDKKMLRPRNSVTITMISMAIIFACIGYFINIL